MEMASLKLCQETRSEALQDIQRMGLAALYFRVSFQVSIPQALAIWVNLLALPISTASRVQFYRKQHSLGLDLSFHLWFVDTAGMRGLPWHRLSVKWVRDPTISSLDLIFPGNACFHVAQKLAWWLGISVWPSEWMQKLSLLRTDLGWSQDSPGYESLGCRIYTENLASSKSRRSNPFALSDKQVLP